ncbi:Oidioi.mRNA.OKI2018_I69.chr2.g5874.t1.cds [Oikopleura dioica]|uniref:Oidioi.mRNA.OKI2018_I69.chr2.g5874.t1.cds n=1 Tax=Oikopleura dioica TaxID=34765 RepID=A0ABN7T585_OIKDI|nr:Oidioi.mRNA.OKI2018_I69.chr2.g5874.t1.cds [Oikopleura dioica]
MNDPYPSRAVREALSVEVNMPMNKINNWMSSRRQKYKRENIPLPGQEIVTPGTPGRPKKVETSISSPSPSSSIQLAVATLPRPVERLPPISTPRPKGEVDSKTEKRSFYRKTLEGLNRSRNKRSEGIMELQEKILALQQKLEEQMGIYKSETEMIDNLKTNATVDDIQLSGDEDNQSDEEDVVVTLLNLKGEPADDDEN